METETEVTKHAKPKTEAAIPMPEVTIRHDGGALIFRLSADEGKRDQVIHVAQMILVAYQGRAEMSNLIASTLARGQSVSEGLQFRADQFQRDIDRLTGRLAYFGATADSKVKAK